MEENSEVQRGMFRTVGEGGVVDMNRLVAAGRYKSAPMKRAVRKAREENRLVDLTYGQTCEWVLFMENGFLVLTGDIALNAPQIV